MTISLIVALTPQLVIGRAGGLPWKLSADLQRFKRLTWGHAIIMGRVTYESIGRPLPGRTSIVVSRQAAHSDAPDLHWVGSLDEALQLAQRCDGNDEVFLIGGGELFREALPLATKAYVTWVDVELPGDTYFPPFPADDWRFVSTEPHPADAKNEYPTRYCIYERSIATKLC